jgi:hypothetical protein
MVVEGDRVAHRWTFRGTHQGEMMGVSPTGEQVTMAGMEINHVRDGKIVESWSISDALGMMRQLGPSLDASVLTSAEGNGATQDLVDQIRNADIERFESVEELAQALSSPPPAPMDVG